MAHSRTYHNSLLSQNIRTSGNNTTIEGNFLIGDEYTFPSSDGISGNAIITDGNGNLTFGIAKGVNRNYETVSSNYTFNSVDEVIFAETPVSDINIYLPLASGNGGKELVIKKTIGAHNVIVNTSNSETVDGDSSLTISYNYESVHLISDNNNWFIT